MAVRVGTEAGGQRIPRRDFLRFAGVAGAAGATSALLAACGSQSPSAGGSKVLKVGVEGPMTGPEASTGAQFKTAVQMAFQAVNYRVGPYKIELVWIDDQADPAAGVAAYTHAVQAQGIQAGLLNWNSSVSVAVMDVAAKYHIPHFFGMGAAGTINQKFNSDRAKYGYWMTKGWPVQTKITKFYVDAVEYSLQKGYWKPASKTVALWGEDTDWGHGEAAGFREQFTAAGWHVVSQDFFPLTQTDFTSLLQRYKSENVALLAGTTTSTPAMAALVKQHAQLGLKSLMIADGLGWVGNWYSLVGPSSNLVIDQIPQFATPAARQFAARFAKQSGVAAGAASAGLAYDYTNDFIQILKQALADHGSLTSETIFDTGKRKLWTGQLQYRHGILMQDYKWTPQTIPDPVTGEGYWIFPVLQYHNGKPTILYPPNLANGKLQAPAGA